MSLPYAPDTTTFGGLVKQLRVKRQLTQQNLAMTLGYSIETIRKVEQDRYTPSQELVDQMIKYLATTPEEQSALHDAAERARPDWIEKIASPESSVGPSNLPVLSDARFIRAEDKPKSGAAFSFVRRFTSDRPDQPGIIAIIKTLHIHIWLGVPVVLVILIWIASQLFFRPPLKSGLTKLVADADGNYLVVQTEGRIVHSGDSIRRGDLVTDTFTIRNNDVAPIFIPELAAGARGPGAQATGWAGPDKSFESHYRLSLKPGETYQYRSSRTFDEPGDYFVEATKKGAEGGWGGIQPFTRIMFFVTK